MPVLPYILELWWVAHGAVADAVADAASTTSRGRRAHRTMETIGQTCFARSKNTRYIKTTRNRGMTIQCMDSTVGMLFVRCRRKMQRR